MSQIWVPPDVAEICPEQIAPLTQCSQLGFMYLTLLTQLYGRSIDSVHKNPYFDHSSEVQNSFTGSGIESSLLGPSNYGSTHTQSPFSQHTFVGQSLEPTVSSFRSFGPPTNGQSLGPFESEEQYRYQKGQGYNGHVLSDFRGPGHHGIPEEQSYKAPSSSSYSSSVRHPYSGTKAPFTQYDSQIPLVSVPIKPHSPQFATGLNPVLRTDFSINHSTKTLSHRPKGTRFPDASFYSQQEFGKPDQSRLQKEFARPSDFKFASSFEKYESPVFDFENIRRSFQDVDTAAADSKVEEKKTSTEPKKKVKNNRRRRDAIEEYDFIVVGAGSAGCVVANRLSEVKKWKILLLEAGPEEPEVTSVPGLAPVLGTSSIDWNYQTQPEEMTCRAKRGQTCTWFSGRVMGGSSSINYLVYMRGNKRDYDEWADLGNHGWSYRKVLPYFKKSENNQDIEAKDIKYHAVGGPMNVERFKYRDENVDMLLGAFQETGLPLVDFNGINQIGTMITQATSNDGKRMSTNVAFIRPIRYKRKNLFIVPNALVTKVLINHAKKIAYGVKFYKNGKWHKAYAKKEVILSAGAIGSPKILLLSGIGPEHDLETLKIPVLKNLNVGRNLQDHATTDAMLMKLTNKTSTLINAQDILNEVKAFYKTKSKDNPLSASGPLQISAFIRTKFAEEDETVPDIQFHFDGRNKKEFYSDSTTYLATNILPLAYYDSINVRPILLRPESTGYLTLNTTDPIFGNPLIYPRFFTKQRDLDTLVAALKFAVTLEDTTAFKVNEVTFIRKPVSACRDFKWGTSNYFSCLFTRYTTTIFHPSGTCKMGPRKDKEAVVNPRLKVHGIKHLRVADASIMPNIVRGNTNAAVIMIGEKVSDMIKEDWREIPIQD